MHKVLRDFEIKVDHQIGAIRLKNNQKRSCHFMNFAVPEDYRVKIQELLNLKKYMDISRELKMLKNVKVSVIAIKVSALGTIRKALEIRIGELKVTGRIAPIETTAQLKFTWIQRRVRETFNFSKQWYIRGLFKIL